MEVLMGKSSINGPCSMAMLNYQRVHAFYKVVAHKAKKTLYAAPRWFIVGPEKRCVRQTVQAGRSSSILHQPLSKKSWSIHTLQSKVKTLADQLAVICLKQCPDNLELSKCLELFARQSIQAPRLRGPITWSLPTRSSLKQATLFTLGPVAAF